MKIRKLDHCCLLIEYKGLRILTDPGLWTKKIDESNIDLVLITHEHHDHFHPDAIASIIEKNPDVKIITNTSVGKHLESSKVPYEVLENFGSTNVKNVLIEAVDEEHEEIWKDFSRVQNTGYFIDSKFFFPGDAYAVPKKKVEILAAPVAGPWNTIKTNIEYMLRVRPRYVIPVHDGGLNLSTTPILHYLPFKICAENFITFVDLKPGGEMTFD